MIYDGEWSGAMGTLESTNSIDGSGEETFEYDVDPDEITSVSINAQKNNQLSDELVVQILENGEVVSEASTTAEFGVASTSYPNC